MFVEDIMSRNVGTCASTDSLADAAHIMWDRDCGCVPVVDDGRVVGLITDRDICMAAYLNGKRPAELRVREIMSAGAITCGPHDLVSDAEQRMRTAQVRRLPVVDEEEGRLVGILSLADIARAAENRRRDVTLDEVAATLCAIARRRPGDVCAGAS